jgi:hypothetical protein
MLPQCIHTIRSSLGNWALATSAANSDTVDNIALLGFVTKTASLVGTRWAGCAVDDVQLSELYFALSAKFNECIAGSSMKMSTSNVPQYSLLVCLEDQIRSIGFAVDLRVVVSYLPASDTEKESQDIGLLLLLKLLDTVKSLTLAFAQNDREILFKVNFKARILVLVRLITSTITYYLRAPILTARRVCRCLALSLIEMWEFEKTNFLGKCDSGSRLEWILAPIKCLVFFLP